MSNTEVRGKVKVPDVMPVTSTKFAVSNFCRNANEKPLIPPVGNAPPVGAKVIA